MDLSKLSDEEKRSLLDLLRRNREAQGLREGEIAPSLGTDVVKSAGSGLAQGLLGLGQLAATPSAATVGALNWVARQAGKLQGKDLPQVFPNPSADALAQLDVGREKVNHRPETVTGRHVKSIAEAVPSAALGPGSLLTKGLVAAGSGVGAQLADDLVAGGDASNGGNAIARFAGSALGSLIPLHAAGKVRNATQLVHESLGEVKPRDFVRAARMEQILKDAGINSHLKSQLLGPNSTLDDLVAQASAFSSTRPKLVSATQDAPKEAAGALNNWLAQNLPPQVSSRREFLGDVQEAATKRISSAQRLSNIRYTNALPKDLPDYDPSRMLDMQDELLNLAKSNKFAGGEGSGALTRFVKEKLNDADGFPITNPHALNNVLKDLNALKKQEGWGGLPTEALKETLRKYTPEFGAARQAKSEVIRDVVEPIQKGLTGDIARIGGGIRPDRFTALESAFSRVFTPDRDQAQEITAFANQIGKDEFSQFFGEYLRKSVTQNLNRASGTDAPHKFSLAIARTTAQQANLNAALRATAEAMGAKPQEVTKGFSNLMRAFDTYKNAKIASGLNTAELGAKAGLNLPGIVIAPHSRAGRFSFDYVSRKTYNQIVDMVTSPDGLKRLEKIAGTKPTSTRMKALVEGLVINSIQAIAAEDEQAKTTEQPQGAQ